MTFYASEQDLPPFNDYSMKGRTYRYFTGKPLFPFGHGLSYTTFALTNPHLAGDSVTPEGTADYSVTVTNTGKRAGDEVVQIYVRAVNPPVPRPIKWLVGFRRVSLKPGESKKVTFALPANLLRRWDETSSRYVVDTGDYEIMAGSSSEDLPCKSLLKVR